MRRHLANALAVALLGVGLFVAAGWGWSYAVTDAVYLYGGGRLVCVYSYAGTVVITAERMSAPESGMRMFHASEWNVPQPVGGSYVAALLHFDVDRMPSGLTSVHFPHWIAAVAAAAWPLARFERRRRRRGRAAAAGFPVEPPDRPGGDDADGPPAG